MAIPSPLNVCAFQTTYLHTKNVDLSGIRTQIVKVEGKHCWPFDRHDCNHLKVAIICATIAYCEKKFYCFGPRPTEEKECQTDEVEREKGNNNTGTNGKGEILNVNAKEEKETWTEIFAHADISCQTDEAQILPPKVSDVADVVVDDGDAAASAASRHPRPASQEGGGGRSSACTQTQAEGVCEAEVQTDIEDVSAIRSVSYPQSPADAELVNHLLIN